jgi:hypothetical protein
VFLEGGLGASIGEYVPRWSTCKATTVICNNEICSTFTAMSLRTLLSHRVFHNTVKSTINRQGYPGKPASTDVSLPSSGQEWGKKTTAGRKPHTFLEELLKICFQCLHNNETCFETQASFSGKACVQLGSLSLFKPSKMRPLSYFYI